MNDEAEKAEVEFAVDSAGEYRWTFKAANGEPMAVSSEGYTRLADAVRSWRTVVEYLGGFEANVELEFSEEPVDEKS